MTKESLLIQIKVFQILTKCCVCDVDCQVRKCVRILSTAGGILESNRAYDKWGNKWRHIHKTVGCKFKDVSQHNARKPIESANKTHP